MPGCTTLPFHAHGRVSQEQVEQFVVAVSGKGLSASIVREKAGAEGEFA
jgi:hypothetical protein